MAAIELRNLVEEYEKTHNIYMNFSIDNDGIWGLAEGSKTQHLLSIECLTEYKKFLQNAVKHYENMSRFFPEHKKTKKKYETYLKRLNNTLNKITIHEIKIKIIKNFQKTIYKIFQLCYYNYRNDK